MANNYRQGKLWYFFQDTCKDLKSYSKCLDELCLIMTDFDIGQRVG